MKRIEFIAPVEAIRGNLSGRQDLKYAENDNKAYESPMSQRNYARNYTPRFVGAKRAKDGLKYFQVRTKTAVGMTAKSKHAMALLGGAGAIIGYILGHKTSDLYAAVVAQYNALYAVSSGQIGSLRAWLSRNVRAGLDAKQAVITLTGPEAPVSIDNPWNTIKGGTTPPNVTISQSVLLKFWSELAANPITYNIGDESAPARAGMTFADVIRAANFLNLTTSMVMGAEKIKKGDLWVKTPDDESYVSSSDEIVAGGQYLLTDVAPS